MEILNKESMTDVTDDFDSEALQKFVSGRPFIKDVRIFRKIDSTNNYAKYLAKQKNATDVLILSDRQTLGRGRASKTWISPPGKGLWFSILLRPDKNLEKLPLLSLGAGLAVAKAIENVLNLNPKLKWPNDVLLSGRKVCGVLLESEFSFEKLNYLIIGIGINVNQDSDDFENNLKDLAGSLKMVVKRSVDRLELLTQVLQQLEIVYHQFLHSQFDSICSEWKKRVCFKENVVVSIRTNEGIITGAFEDIDAYGRLILRLGKSESKLIQSGTIINWQL